jgi:hypothetical protein
MRFTTSDDRIESSPPTTVANRVASQDPWGVSQDGGRALADWHLIANPRKTKLTITRIHANRFIALLDDDDPITDTRRA